MNEDEKKRILEEIKEAVMSGKVSVLNLYTMYGMAIASTAGAAACQR